MQGRPSLLRRANLGLANDHVYGNVHYTKRPRKKDGVGGKFEFVSNG
jgi:hypothetical protein